MGAETLAAMAATGSGAGGTSALFTGAAVVGTGAAIAQTAITIEQSRAQASAARDAQKIAKEQLRVRQQSLAQQAADRRKNIRDEQQRVLGRIRVASAAATGGLDRSGMAFIQQAELAAAGDIDVIDRDLGTGLRISGLQTTSQLNKLGAQIESPLVAGFRGGLGGLQTGLSILSLGKQLERLFDTDQ